MTEPRSGQPPSDDLRLRPFVAEPATPAAPPQSPPAQAAPPRQAQPPQPANPREDDAFGGDAGVRPYLLTGGRTRSGHLAGGFETLVVVTELGRERYSIVTPEQRALLRSCTAATSIAELSARLRLPLGVTQVLAGDLVGAGFLAQYATPDDAATDPVLLRRLIRAVEGI